MSFAHGSQIRVLLNELEVSSEISGARVTHQRAMSDVTTVGQTAGAAGSKFIPGLMSGSVGLRGPVQSDHTQGIASEIQWMIGVDNDFVLTVLPNQDNVGRPAFFMVGDTDEYAIDAAVADAVGMTFNAQADESVDMGFVLVPLSAITADALTGTAVDRGASPITPTTHGLMAAVHVTAFSGFSGVVVKVQHSADNSSWSDLATFTTITGTGAERIKVADGTTVNRYLRASVDVTGTGSVTLLVAAAPR